LTALLSEHKILQELSKKIPIKRRLPVKDDVLIEIQYTGICHSDLHQIRGEWNQTNLYPMVPGHEIVGIVTQVGPETKKFKVGDRVGVGCMVGSCRSCENCQAGKEQNCSEVRWTYNCLLQKPEDIHVQNSPDGELLFGGYSTFITVQESFVVSIPESIPFEAAAPLLCAGITTYSPLVHFQKILQVVHPKASQLRLAVAGFGGLGEMAVKIGKKLGFHVTVLSTSARKRQAALDAGADAFIVSTDEAEAASVQKSFHMILDTISADHSISRFLSQFLKADGVLCLVGLPAGDIVLGAFDVVGGRKTFAGSNIGGIQETQDMLNFCAAHKIFPTVQLIDAKDINHSLYALACNAFDARRFVIRIKETLAPVAQNSQWEVEDEPAIDTKTWHVHPHGKIHPPSANVHATMK